MFKPNSRGGAGDRPLKGWPRHEAAKPILAVHNFCREKPDRTVHPSCPPSRSFRLRRIPTGSRRRARLRLVSRPGSSTEPAGESPVQVSAGASGSRPQFSVERPAAQRGVETLLEETLSILDSLRNKILPLEWRATYVAAVRAHYELHIGLLMAMHRSEPTRGGPLSASGFLLTDFPGKPLPIAPPFLPSLRNAGVVPPLTQASEHLTALLSAVGDDFLNAALRVGLLHGGLRPSQRLLIRLSQD